jgi:hypothetical protein
MRSSDALRSVLFPDSASCRMFRIHFSEQATTKLHRRFSHESVSQLATDRGCGQRRCTTFLRISRIAPQIERELTSPRLREAVEAQYRRRNHT